MLPAAQSVEVSASAVIVGGRCLLRGWSTVETSGAAPATVTIYDAGKVSTAKRLASIGLAQGVSDTKMPTGLGVYAERGLYVVITGTADAVIYFNAETRIFDLLAMIDEDSSDISAWKVAAFESLVGGA